MNFNSHFNKKISFKIREFYNKLFNNRTMYCEFCKGKGFINCSCEYGCIRCRYDKIYECPYCDGDGSSKYGYNYNREK